MVWILPLTTKGKQDQFHCQIKVGEIISSVVLSQVKAISTKRLRRKAGVATENDFRGIVSRIINFLTNENPLLGVISEAEATNTGIINESKN